MSIVCQLCGKDNFKTKKSLTAHKRKCKPLETGFRIEFKQFLYFKKLVEVMSKWVENGVISIDKDTLYMKGTDVGKNASLYIKIESAKFRVFNPGKDEEYNSVVFYAVDLEKVLRRGNKDDTLVMEFDTSLNKLKVVFKRDTGRNRTFKLGTLDPEEAVDFNYEGFINEITFTVSFDIDPELLHDIVKDADICSEVMTIQTKENEVTFEAFGTSGEFEAQLGTEEVLNLLIDKQGASMFSISSLKNIFSLTSAIQTLTFKFAHMFPLLMEITLKNEMTVYYGQGPRIDQELEEFDEFGEEELEAIEANQAEDDLEEEEWDESEEVFEDE